MISTDCFATEIVRSMSGSAMRSSSSRVIVIFIEMGAPPSV